MSAPDDSASTPLWRPAAERETLAARAGVIRRLRRFFHHRGLLEVQTPLLSRGIPAEANLEPLPAGGGWLRTSPEAAMKRLLAAGSGPIFQIGPVFRRDEAGALHNPEFTLLEWYRPGWSLAELMGEVADLVRDILNLPPIVTVSYQTLFQEVIGLDPLAASRADLIAATADTGVDPQGLDRDGLLDLLLTARVEPALRAKGDGLFVTGFPASRAAMAQVDPGPPPTARRFELFVAGMELANGYQELTDAIEQRARLEQANRERSGQGLPALPLDERFLEALEAGLPDCAGVALGVDRLVMLALDRPAIQEVLAFPWERV